MVSQSSACLIIGAGISGLLIARRLQEEGREVLVLEKGRGFGGRMATRRAGEARYDHGAQYFTVRDERFQRWVDRMVEAKVVREWFRNFPEDNGSNGHPRYVGVEGISDIGKFLAEGLDVRRATKAAEVRRIGAQWHVRAEDGTVFMAERLVVTSPVPQTLELLDGSGVEFSTEIEERLRAVCYEKGLAVMAQLDGASGLSAFGGVRVTEGPLTWLADNQMKGISGVPAVTLHSDGIFAEHHWDSPDEVRGPLLIAAARPYLKAEVVSFQCHRWGFTKPTRTFGAPFLYDRGNQLLLAGDSFGGPRVEGAALSGIEAAEEILKFGF
jgi:predicted NAD/FAD-dependent oxidoreductase